MKVYIVMDVFGKVVAVFDSLAAAEAYCTEDIRSYIDNKEGVEVKGCYKTVRRFYKV